MTETMLVKDQGDGTTVVETSVLNDILDQAAVAKDPLVLDSDQERRVWEYAARAVKAGIVPIRRGENEEIAVNKAFCAMIFGIELGLTRQQALSNVTVVDQKPALGAKIKLGICLSRCQFDERPEKREFHMDKLDTDGEDQAGVVWHCKRDGIDFTGTFTVADAKRAQLWFKGPDSNWGKYPKDMLSHRAMDRCLDPACADILMGAHTAESLEPGEFAVNETPRLPEPMRKAREGCATTASGSVAMKTQKATTKETQGGTPSPTEPAPSANTAAGSSTQKRAAGLPPATTRSTPGSGQRSQPSGEPARSAAGGLPETSAPGSVAQSTLPLPPKASPPPKTAQEAWREKHGTRVPPTQEPGPVGFGTGQENSSAAPQSAPAAGLPTPSRETETQEEKAARWRVKNAENYRQFMALAGHLSGAQIADIKQKIPGGVYPNMEPAKCDQALKRAKFHVGVEGTNAILRKLDENSGA